MNLRCKPNQLVMIVKASAVHPCSARYVGCPAHVTQLQPLDGLVPLLAEALEGPTWVFKEALRCPHGDATCRGVDRMPDSCLRPFDPESEPEAEAAPASEEVPQA